MRPKLRQRIVPLALAASLVPGATSAAFQDTVERSFQVAPGGRLVLESDLGDVEVVVGEADRVRVIVERRVRAADDRDAAEGVLRDLDLEIRQHGDDVHVRAEYGGRWRLWDWVRRNRLDLRFRIEVPRRYDAEIGTGGGDIRIRALEGDIRAKTSGGDLEVEDVRGSAWARTSGGDVRLSGALETADVGTSGGDVFVGTAAGEVRASTSGGDVEIVRAGDRVTASTSGGDVVVREVAGEIQAATSGGDVEARITAQPAGDCRLSTSGGDVVVYLAAGLALDLDAKASGGDVETEIPIQVLGKIGGSSLRGRLNGGGPALVLRTSGGDITIRRVP